ncbi:MAG: hypothetical protein HXX12_01390 [Geothrix sp.]|uniref:hypothetical protein n=1 Tax=Geothrix sp. TaxID=1962974 RepID=UPI0017B35C91|nr:hypothetical protein [Geothrix sp.]NWJ39606.1 hypothetical protein [Geothrix sp.]WIL22371.1 MAG: hypothetical protein QOZ81_001674 [Geothrix sp.]
MLHRWQIGFILGLGLLAGQPAQPRNQAWVLALDGRGAMVGDLKPEEFRVKVDGKIQTPIQVKTPAQTAEAAQSWVLVFEPIRDTNMRATAFIAAADFLTKVPDGDRVFIVIRGKDSLESLMPGFSLRRGLWAEALAKVPNLLPEGLVGISKESLQGAGYRADFTDAADGSPGQEALTALLVQFRSGAPGWAKGTIDQRGVSVLDRLNLNNPGFVSGLLATVAREAKVLGGIIDQLASMPGQKHLVVFSRCEADDLTHPSVKQAATRPDRRPGDTTGTGFVRERGDMGGPAEAASLATRDLTLLQADLKARAVSAGVTLYSVAGAGQNVMGQIGTIAPATGGFAFPLSIGVETQFGQGIQVFGSRYLVQWREDAAPGTPVTLEVTTTRKDVKLVVQSLR